MKINTVGSTLHGGPVDESEVQRVREALLFEGSVLRKKLVRFFCLLILAASIATFGLLGNDIAVVIGAMIVAPLMLPIMGLAFSVSIGDRTAIFNALLISLGGIVTAIAIGFILTLPIAGFFQPESIDQIMNRTAPRLLDLLAALATGLAGAFALSRRDVSDTLPGVAIAVSLVPPLANVGALLAFGKTSLAMGSLLLFITNYLAILITGTLVFGLMGFPQASLIKRSIRTKYKAIAITLVPVIIIMIPLSLTSYSLFVSNSIKARIYNLTNDWLAGSGYRIIDINTETADKSVKMILLGEGELPSLDLLQEQSRGQAFGRVIQIETIHSSAYFIFYE